MSKRDFKQTITIQGMCSQSTINNTKTFAAQVNVVDLLNTVTIGHTTPSGTAIAKNKCLDAILDPSSDIQLPVFKVRVSQCDVSHHDNDYDTLAYENGNATALTNNDYLNAFTNICNYHIELAENEEDEPPELSTKDEIMLQAMRVLKATDVVVVFIFDSASDDNLYLPCGTCQEETDQAITSRDEEDQPSITNCRKCGTETILNEPF